MNTAKDKVVIYFGRKGYKWTIPSLLKLLGHRDENICSDAEEILIKLGVTKEKIVKTYIAALKLSYGEVKSKIIHKLDEIGDQRAIKPLLPYLIFDKNNEVKIALEKLGATKDQMVDVLSAALASSTPIYQKNAIKRLSELGGEKAINVLLPYLSRKNYNTEVEIALENLGATKEQIVDSYIAALAGSSSLMDQRNAAKKLGELEDQRAIEPLIKKLLDKNDVLVSIFAAEALVKLGDKNGREFLIWQLSANKSIDISITAANVLANLGDQRGVEFLIEMLKRIDVLNPSHVIQSLNRLGINDPRVDSFNKVIQRFQDKVGYELSSNFDWKLVVDAYNIIEDGKNFEINVESSWFESSDEYYDWKGTNYGHVSLRGPDSYSVNEINDSQG